MKNPAPYSSQIQLLTKENIQTYLSISRATLYRLLKSPDFPDPFVIEDGIRYWDKEDLDNYFS